MGYLDFLQPPNRPHNPENHNSPGPLPYALREAKVNNQMSLLPTSGLLGPVVALNAWTLVMETWMYATRIPAFTRLNIGFDNTATKSQLDLKTPASTRWKADNYNHLLEQPTQFYAIALVLAIARRGKDEKMDLYLAWAYVGIRIVHSFAQATSNNIPRRFGLFALSSCVLAAMTGRAGMLLF